MNKFTFPSIIESTELVASAWLTCAVSDMELIMVIQVAAMKLMNAQASLPRAHPLHSYIYQGSYTIGAVSGYYFNEYDFSSNFSYCDFIYFDYVSLASNT